MLSRNKREGKYAGCYKISFYYGQKNVPARHRRGLSNLSDIFSTNEVLYTDNHIGIVELIKQRINILNPDENEK